MTAPPMDSSDQPLSALLPTLSRIAAALERLAPSTTSSAADLWAADGFVWHRDGEQAALQPVAEINRLALSLLKGVERQRDTLLDNTLRFAKGLPANNALLWGARGTGKSALIKAVHGAVAAQMRQENTPAPALVEIHREDIPTLPQLLNVLRSSDRRCVLFCDDLSFDGQDSSYKSLKAVLEGGIEGRPSTVVFYATSNRRHLLAREMIENERSTAIHAGEAVEEKVSLSDRFGLWLGFHNMDQETFFAIILGYAGHFQLSTPPESLKAQAIEWSVTRGSRSGRTAWQFIQEVAGREGKTLGI
ncbi:MAG: ATP-binding protein [Rhodospirillaceae bacterium]